MTISAPKKPTDKSPRQMKDILPSPPSKSHDVRSALSNVVSVVASQVDILVRKAEQGKLDFEDSRLLGSYARALCMISNEERHQAALVTTNLGDISDEDLERLAEESRETLGR